MKEERFMRLAIKKAKEGAEKGYGGPFGAVITKDNKIVAKAYNTVLKNKDPTAHAEVNAIRKACKKLKTWDLSNCTIYSSCEPCVMCFSAIHWANISKIFYSASIEDSASSGFSEMHIKNEKLKELANLKTDIMPNFLQEEGKKIFEWWNQKKDKKIY